jgi:hypothetical protein
LAIELPIIIIEKCADVLNMIQNIGFGGGTTHTKSRDSRMPAAACDIAVDVVHPAFVLPCTLADDSTYRLQLRLARFHDLKPYAKRVLGIRRTAHV